MRKELTKKLADSAYVCTTADAWSAHNRGYLGVTDHWLSVETVGNASAQIKRHSAALACKRLTGTHDGESIGTDIHKEFKIQNKLSHSITDNASNFIRAFRLYGKPLGATGQQALVDDQSVNETESDQDEDETNGDRYVPITFLDPDETVLPEHFRCAAHTLNLIATTDASQAETNSGAYKKIFRSATAKLQAL